VISFNRLRRSAVTIALAMSAAGCSSPATKPVAPATKPAGPDDARGGRLYDNWRAEKDLDTFVPDSAKTPEVDGKGGPHGNGTLDNARGEPIANTGHDYRLKNLFGWDLRGASGIYGPEYQKKAYVLQRDLLADTRPAAEVRAWLTGGDDQGMPAFGAVLDDRDLDDLVAFLIKTRERELVTPERVFKLDSAAPKGFVLLAGGDAARGKQKYKATCAECHGDDGRKIAIDEVESVGTISRSSGYEIWFKIAHGQPGTDMDRQLEERGGQAQAQTVLDLFAALCDRAAFPAMANGKDVPDGDPRCGAYLR
jgi:mono/diheme cytochrome c family protein